MKLKTFYKIVFLLTGCLFFMQQNSTLAQQYRFEKLRNLDQQASAIYADEEANFYITQDLLLKKFDKDGQFLSQYDSFYFSDFGSIDVSDIFHVLVFYPDQQVAVKLDQTLQNVIDSVNFDNLGFDVQAVCTDQSGDGLWIYDANTNAIYHLDRNNKSLHVSSSLKALTNNEGFSPQQLLLAEGRLYAIDVNFGLLIFDEKAKFIDSNSTSGIIRASYNQGSLVWFNQRMMISYNPISDERSEVLLPGGSLFQAGAFNFNLIPGRLFLVDMNGTIIYGVQ